MRCPPRGVELAVWRPESDTEQCASARCQPRMTKFIRVHANQRSVETYTKANPLVGNPGYDADRVRALEALSREFSKGSIDEPTVDIVERFTRLPFCYTLQSCYGHFMREFRTDDRNTKRVADLSGAGTTLHYRIAYIALCVQGSAQGRALLRGLRAIQDVDPEYIQFGSADWFWRDRVNTYVLQVSPLKNACEDHFDVSIEEALRIESARDRFLDELRELLSACEDL